MIRYKIAKKAIYLTVTDEYDINEGWLHEQREAMVVGETKDCYITEFKDTKIGYWDEMGKYETWLTMSIGFHKSRFIKWCTTQLELF